MKILIYLLFFFVGILFKIFSANFDLTFLFPLPLCKCADFSVKSKYLKVIGEENSCPKNKNLTLNLQQICELPKTVVY